MFFALALTGFVQILWSALYGVLGYQLSASLPLGYLVLSLVTLAIYLVTLIFNFFRVAQLGLFLFFPFVLQWSIGNFISASGVVLWGLLAPVGAILLFNARESIPWFVAYIVFLRRFVPRMRDLSKTSSEARWNSQAAW